jgi:hypothetical protein
LHAELVGISFPTKKAKDYVPFPENQAEKALAEKFMPFFENEKLRKLDKI